MKNNNHTIRRIKYRDLYNYLLLRNNCIYENPADAPKVQHLPVEKTFFIFNKLCKYFLPVFSQRYNIFGYYINNRLIGFHHSSKRHPLWPYNIQGKTKKRYTQLVAVEHSHRRKGIGKKLSSYIAKYYSNYDIFNKIPVTNTASIGIAKSLDFQPYDLITKYILHVPKLKYHNTNFRRPFSIINNRPQISNLYELYKTSLLPELIKIEKPLVDYFKISPLYRINLYLFNLLGIYSEGRFVRLKDNQSHVKAFVQVRNYMMTRRSEMLIIASEKLSDSDLNWVKEILYALATTTGQKEIIAYTRKNQTNIHNALKALDFTQLGDYRCFVRKAQQ